MDFFAHQDEARRKTGLLIAYYVVAVVLIIIGVYLAFAGVFIGVKAQQSGEVEFGRLWNADLFLLVTGATVMIVALGTLSKVAQLRGGGASVARMLGGRPLNTNTNDPDERKILNIVEEMAIASGTPVPQVFILDDEPAINAFAAGFTPSNAVVAVTRGCIKELSRDELQGVIAHEFSHVLNGDMRLNIRLMGVLNGILVIAITGYWIMRTTMYSGRSRSRRKGSGVSIALLGLILMIIGYIGVFFGKLIKSAVSRQREFLADASAVQFTRNPAGIAAALKKIGGFSAGSRIRSAKAEEASHFFFGNGLGSSFLGLMSTHPPLQERIKRLDASFAAMRTAEGAQAGKASGTAATVSGFASGEEHMQADPDEVVARVGAPQAHHLAYARQIISQIPDSLAAAVREPFGARAVVYSLLLDDNSTIRTKQMERLKTAADAAVYEEVNKLGGAVANLNSAFMLPLVDLAIPALKDLSAAQYEQFKANVEKLVVADEEIDLFEYTLQRIITRHLEPSFANVKPTAIQYYDMKNLLKPAGDLLTCLALWGADTQEEAQTAFNIAVTRLEVDQPPCLGSVNAAGLNAVDEALTLLASASPTLKKKIVAACTACVAADGKITVEEAELLRSITDSLDCPLPPFVADIAA